MGQKYTNSRPPQPSSSSYRNFVWPGVIAVVLVVVVALAIWLLQGGLARATYTPEVTGRPSAAIDQTMFDYGDVKFGNTIKTVFTVRNVGDAQLAFNGEPRVQVLEGC